MQLVMLMCDGVTYHSADRWLRNIGLGAAAPDREPDAEKEYDEEWLRDFDTPPRWALEERGITATACRRFEIKWDDDGEAWVLPIRDADSGVLRGWQTKTASETLTRKHTRKSLTLFGITQFECGTTAILVESPLDCARLLTAQFAGGVASFGADVSERHVELLSQRAGRIIIALDNDAAGHTGTEKLLVRLEGCGRPVYSFNYGGSPGKDVGELDDDEIAWGIAHAVPRTY